MNPCPKCGATDSVALGPILAAKPPSSYAIAGVQPKLVAEMRYVLSCTACDLRVVGQLEGAELDENGVFTGGHFVAEESTGEN